MELLEYLAAGVTPHQVVKVSAEMLEEEGFQELKLDKPFAIENGGRYFIKAFSTTLVAFTVGESVEETQNFHIAAAHTDHPCLHLKPKAELRNGDYMKIDTEVYGGPINNTWMDRPLSVAGIVALKGRDSYSPEIRYVDFKRPVCTVPNLAIHMNRELNRGTELKPQTDLIPTFGPMKEGQDKDAFFIEALARELDVDSAFILDFDLYVYCCDKPEVIGYNEDMISSPRLDNLTSGYALLEGISSCTRADGSNIAALFDHEEIGSGTKQGADSALLETILKKIYAGLGFAPESLTDSILGSFLFSVDVAHATHPSHPEKYDPINNAPMNSGVMIKINSNQRYTFDTSAVATAVSLCEAAGAKYTKYANHSDVAGGRTLGPMISSHLPMRTVDIGVPMLAMHSARELMGYDDEEALIKLMKEFYK
ncbi:MAG: M18 family aminopeptidase [Lachnospiraceae bacterium]|nr:M18 family aminopeptidase [Lachnospiraceae bacterium]